MDVAVAVDPGLGLDAAALAAGWNESEEHHRLAQARLERQAPAGFPFDPELVENGLILLAGAAGTLAMEGLKAAVKELVTEFMKRRREKGAAGEPRITVQQVRQPDGAVLLVVREERR